MRFMPRDSFLVNFFICTNEFSMSRTSLLFCMRGDSCLTENRSTENEHPQESGYFSASNT